MTKGIILAVVLLSLVGCTENKNEAEIVYREVSYYADSSLQHEVFLKDGKPEGLA